MKGKWETDPGQMTNSGRAAHGKVAARRAPSHQQKTYAFVGAELPGGIQQDVRSGPATNNLSPKPVLLTV